MDITSLIIQLIVGAIGGNVAGKVDAGQEPRHIRQHDCRRNWWFWLGGQILNAVLGGGATADAAAGAAGGMDIGAIIQQVAGGGIGGAVLMIIVGVIKGAMNKS